LRILNPRGVIVRIDFDEDSYGTNPRANVGGRSETNIGNTRRNGGAREMAVSSAEDCFILYQRSPGIDG
jgi:hypothetical protein